VANGDVEFQDRVEWCSTCSLHFQRIRLQSWCGKDLTNGHGEISRRSDIKIEMGWPTGPMRKMVISKRRVRCDVHDIDLSLFVVLNHIGEPSHHLDRWIRFKEMPIEKLLQASNKERIMVHYGYDEKDADPSTYNV
jgi:hypothetical protein